MLSQVQKELDAIKTILYSYRQPYASDEERQQRLYELSNDNHNILVYMSLTEDQLKEMLLEIQKKENHFLAIETTSKIYFIIISLLIFTISNII